MRAAFDLAAVAIIYWTLESDIAHILFGHIGTRIRSPYAVKSFSTSIDIDAPAARVWAIMSDIERWHEWTASVRRVHKIGSGELRVGTRAVVRQPKLPPAFWRVTALQPGREFTWVSKGPGMLVTARHSVDPALEGSRATLSIHYAGRLAPLLVWMTRDINDRYLSLEANGLKRRSEARESR